MKADIKIKWKLFFYLFIFVFIMLVTLWLFQTVFLSDFYKAIKTQQIKSVAKYIEANIDSEELPTLLFRIQRHDNGLSVVICEEDGTIMLAPRLQEPTASFRMTAALALSPSEINELIKRVKGKGVVSILQPGENTQEAPPFVAVPFIDRMALARPARSENITHMSEAVNKNGEKIYIILTAMITPVNATVMTLRVQLILISVILTLIAILLSLIIAKKFAKPIMDINEVAKQLTIGNYDVTFNAGGYKEINELNNTLNKAAYELSRVENLRRELLANVSHDLRTPLTMITGFAEMIRDLPGENTPENTQIIIDESNRLNRLVSDLLDISQLESGGGAHVTSVFCITELIAETAERMGGLEALLTNRRIIFEPETESYINANESQITQVIYNLIANALNYSDNDVIIKQYIENKKVRIEVCDSGHGIAEDDLPYVWDRYYKASGSHKRANIGTGLGLSIVKGVIGNHGGACGVNSTEGIGSVFWFELECLDKGRVEN